MVTLQVTIAGLFLSAHYGKNSTQMDSVLASEIESFAISEKWDAVQAVRDGRQMKDIAITDPQFPEWDVDDALHMWDVRWADRSWAYDRL